jgi:NitT/TauT family transport system ATP-binding protein
MYDKLVVQNVSYSYHSLEGETQALYDLTFSVHTGEFLAIVGPSGCGKSTLLSLLCGMLKPESGEIIFCDKAREHMSGKTIGQPADDDAKVSESFNSSDTVPRNFGSSSAASANLRIGYMLQKDHLFEWRTILGNVSLGLEIQKKLNDKSRGELLDMLAAYGLNGFEDAHPSELSGGMRQRAALIRTLALKPDLLLLDEPFSALDYQTRLTVCDDISRIIRGTGKTAVLITHDLAEAVSVADRIIVLSARPGRILATLDTPFAPEYDSPLKRRSAPEFQQYFQKVWSILQHG